MKRIGMIGGFSWHSTLEYYRILNQLACDRNFIHESIFTELVGGRFLAATKRKYLDVIERLVENGAEGIILGCTEIPLLIQQHDTETKLFATTEIHCVAAIEAAF